MGMKVLTAGNLVENLQKGHIPQHKALRLSKDHKNRLMSDGIKTSLRNLSKLLTHLLSNFPHWKIWVWVRVKHTVFSIPLKREVVGPGAGLLSPPSCKG